MVEQLRACGALVVVALTVATTGCDAEASAGQVDAAAAGEDLAVAGPGPDLAAGGGREACGDGLDNDGNGMIDEGCECTPGASQDCYPGQPSTAGVGACARGRQTCEGAEFGRWSACVGAVTPRAEVCGDGVDQDCDGSDTACRDMTAPPSDMAALPSDMAAPPSDMTAPPPDLTAAPSDLTAAPSDLTAAPSDLTAAPDMSGIMSQECRAVIANQTHSLLDAFVQKYPLAQMPTTWAGIMAFSPSVGTVTLKHKTLMPGDEFVDKTAGGLTAANVEKGRAFAHAAARKTLPADATIVSTKVQPAQLNSWGVKNVDGYKVPTGVGWAFGSDLYTRSSTPTVVYEMVHFYIGFITASGDGEAYLFFEQETAVCR